jgi:hypothetical protein
MECFVSEFEALQRNSKAVWPKEILLSPITLTNELKSCNITTTGGKERWWLKNRRERET